LFHIVITMSSARKIRFFPVLLIISCGVVGFSGIVVADEIPEVETLDGDGTEDEPYEITNIDELQAISQDLEAHYVLENDIDASETETWNAGAGFEPIGDSSVGFFTGTFDGQGYTISDLTIDHNERRTGLFGGNEGTIRDLTLDNANVRGTDTLVGIVVGENNGEIKRVHSSGSVEAEGWRVGGLVGWMTSEATMEQSSSNATVTGVDFVGGLVGELNVDSEIVKSYAKGEVTGTDEHVGGLLGWSSSGSEIRNSYSKTEVSGDIPLGGLIGSFDSPASDVYAAGSVSGSHESGGLVAETDDEATLSSGYWDTESTSQTDGAGNDAIGTGLETAEMTGAAAEANMDLDFENFWTATDEYPILEWQVQDVDLEVSQPAVGEGETTDVTVTLTLDDGSTVTASEVAEFDSETAVAEAEAGTLEANSVGETDLTATVAGESDTQTVEVLEPPSIELVDAEFDTETAVEGATVEATATYENTGGPGSETAVVTVGGEDVTSSVLEIDADGETTRTLSWEATEGGLVDLDGEELGELSTLEAGTVGLESIELPEEAAQDSEYDIDLKLTNEADGPVTDTVELRIDGEHAADESVTVDGDGSTETITGSHDEQGTATHVVELHDTEETAMMEIVEPAEFTLEDLEAPETVAEGSEETFTATVRNVGGGEDEAEISLEVDGETVETKSTTLAVEETDTLEFEMPGETAGEVDVVVESPDDSLETALSVEADDGIPGFTASVVAVALVAVVSLVARRR